MVELLSQGMRNKELAASLGITERTAEVHVRNILTKLNVKDRTAAVSVAIRRGIINLLRPPGGGGRLCPNSRTMGIQRSRRQCS